MISIRSNPLSYLGGVIVALLGLFLLLIPSFLAVATIDSPTSPTDIRVLLTGAILGLPLIATGIVLTQKRYRLTLYLALFTGIIYVIAPLTLTHSTAPVVYLPAAIVFFVVFLALLFVATVRLSS